SFAYSFTEARSEPRLDIEKLKSDGIPQGPLWGRLRSGADVAHAGRMLRSSDYVVFPNPPRRIVVGGDNDRPELLSQACEQAQALIHEATYTKEIADRLGDSRGHSTAAAVAGFAQAIGLPNLVLTHFSPRYQADASLSPSIE